MTGLTSNPTIFEQAIKNSSAYDTAIGKMLERGKTRRGYCSSTSRSRISRVPRICFARSTIGPTASMVGYRWKFRRCLPTTRPALLRRPKAVRSGRPSESVDQDSGHQRRIARHRRSDLRGSPDQRDTAVFTRALSGRGRGVSAWHRTADRCGAQSERRLCRFGFRQPLGRRSEGQGARRHCAIKLGIAVAKRLTRPTGRCSVRHAGSALQSRRPSATVAVGQHRNQGSLGLRRVVHQGSGGTVHREHHARENAESPRRHGEIGAFMPADGGDCEAVVAKFAKAGVDVDAWVLNSRMKARSLSSSPGMT